MKHPRIFRTVVLVGVLVCLSGCMSKGPGASRRMAADSPDKIDPLGVGQKIPRVMLRDANGGAVDLQWNVARQPTVLIFYRGGWCPFCTRHLAAIGQVQPKLAKMGYQILAISPDRPAELAKSVDKGKLEYMLLSDSNMAAARAFGLAFRVDDETVDLYKTKYKIDLEASSGRTHHELPVPAAYIIDTSGTVRSRYVNPDYKSRIDPDKLLAEAKAALKTK